MNAKPYKIIYYMLLAVGIIMVFVLLLYSAIIYGAINVSLADLIFFIIAPFIPFVFMIKSGDLFDFSDGIYIFTADFLRISAKVLYAVGIVLFALAHIFLFVELIIDQATRLSGSISFQQSAFMVFLIFSLYIGNKPDAINDPLNPGQEQDVKVQ